LMPRIFCVLHISRDDGGGRSRASRYIVFPDGFAGRPFASPDFFRIIGIVGICPANVLR
jgi:hypothetical protein